MIKFSYHRDPENPRRVLTVARVVDEEAVVSVGAALCSPKDQFSKVRGRQIATGRLAKNPLSDDMPLEEDESPRSRAITMLREFAHELTEMPFVDRILDAAE